MEALIVPPDLQAALAAVAGGEELFSALFATVRKGALQQISSAKRPEPRAQRVAAAVRLTDKP
ncbi:MAG: YdeI/OmpD-associated family protein [Hymenobacteraceae bacterium]|nr:YdeI/OmpD-associated family protein [Hymenobacteraceae bacterium]